MNGDIGHKKTKEGLAMEMRRLDFPPDFFHEFVVTQR